MAPDNGPIGAFPEHEDKTFYFQHLTNDQKIGFIEMLNAGLVNIDGGGFPVLPYFVRDLNPSLASLPEPFD